MQYTTYGKTGIEVSRIGFGAMRFPDQNDVDQCATLVKACYDAGINYFDTAPGYGKSEDLMGVAFKDMLKTRKEKPFYVSTKTFKAKPDEVRRELETSLTRMGLDYVDFYHVWCVLSPAAWKQRKNDGVLKAFEQLKEEGLVRNIVVSSHMRGEDIGGLMEDYPFEGVLLGYSAMNFPYREQGIEAAARLGRGVVVMNPLGGGIIPQHPERFPFLKTREDETIVEAALRFLFNDPRITIALVGISNEDHLKEAVSAIDGFEPIPQSKIQDIRRNLSESFNEMCTGCQYCDSCPEGIPVPQLMDAYNQYMLSGDPQQMLNRLKWHWGIQADDPRLRSCIECEQCENACTQNLAICERMRFICQTAERYLAEQQK